MAGQQGIHLDHDHDLSLNHSHGHLLLQLLHHHEPHCEPHHSHHEPHPFHRTQNPLQLPSQPVPQPYVPLWLLWPQLIPLLLSHWQLFSLPDPPSPAPPSLPSPPQVVVFLLELPVACQGLLHPLPHCSQSEVQHHHTLQVHPYVQAGF